MIMRSLVVAVLALTAMHSASIAQAPDSLSFQGFLTDTLGNPIDSTGVGMTFKLYKGGAEIWSEPQTVDVSDGVFNVLLGKVTDLSTLAFDQPMDLGIKLDNEASEISPRTPLAAAAFAKALPGLYTFYRGDSNYKSYNVIGGGVDNVLGAGVIGATIGGGGGFFQGNDRPNSVLDNYGTVGGGVGNTASSLISTVGGGFASTAEGAGATIAGGFANVTGANYTTIGGGSGNLANKAYATVAGGWSNQASGELSMIPGGISNSTAHQAYASFAAGEGAKAVHAGTFVWSDTLGGATLSSTGPNQFLIGADGGVGIGTNSPGSPLTVNGRIESETGGFKFPDGTIQTSAAAAITNHWKVGGNSGTTPGTNYLGTSDGAALEIRAAGGVGINTNQPVGSLHVGGATGSGKAFFVQAVEEDRVAIYYVANAGVSIDSYRVSDGRRLPILLQRAGGNVAIHRADASHPLHVGTDGTNGNGAHVTAGGSWNNGSSQAFKARFAEVDPRMILDELASVSIETWEYKDSDEGRHIGPVAEDFYEAFGLGQDDRYISTVDADGVALAAIQGLYELVQEQQNMLTGQQAEIERMRTVMERAGLH